MQRSPIAFPALILGLSLASSLSSQAPTYKSFGTGCPGSSGIPVLSAGRNDLPVIGQSFGSEVRNIPFRASGVGITGRSDKSWGRTPLPYDLTMIGMPGCLLYTDVRYTRTLLSFSGAAQWSTMIPNDSRLIGQDFYQQALILDSSVRGLGVIMSNATHGVMGVLPDLEITSGTPTVTPPSISAGGTVSMSSFTVRNTGNGAAGAFQTAYYLSTDQFIASTDQFLLGLMFPPMAPGTLVTAIPRNLNIPASTIPGSYWIGMLADRTNAIVESSEGNNAVSTPLTVTAALPDLVVSSGGATLTPTTVEAGRTVNASAITVMNVGAAGAGTFSVGYYLSNNAAITTGDRFLVGVGITSLAAGASVTISSRDLTIPVDTPAGRYYIGIIVDRTNAIPESHEGNNTAASPLAVTAPLPDLYISSSMPSVTPDPLIRPPLVPGLPALFELGDFTVTNSGLVASGIFRIGIYFSRDSVITTGDHLSGSILVGSLPPGGSANLGSRLLWSSGGIPGEYWVGIFVDDQGAVTEGNESNNIKTRKVFVLN